MKYLLLLVTIVFLFACSTAAQKAAPKVDFAKKIMEAMPPPLPQSPVEKRAGTDARDENLKGTIKRVIEYTQYAGSLKRVVDKDNFYDENGNLTKTVHYDEGYPQSVTVWGYVDGMRVNRSGDITYAAGEKPVSGRNIISVSAEDNTRDPNAPRDKRYQMRHVKKYDDRNRLIEKSQLQNNGEIWTRETYTYVGNRKEVRDFGQDGNEWSRTAYTLDASGNSIEQHMPGGDNEPLSKNVMKHEFDPKGNWIVERTYEETAAGLKRSLKLLWTSYRTIEYYP